MLLSWLRKTKSITEGIIVKTIPYRCWDSRLRRYVDIKIPAGHVVQVHYNKGVPVKINTKIPEVLADGYICLDPLYYGGCVRVLRRPR